MIKEIKCKDCHNNNETYCEKKHKFIDENLQRKCRQFMKKQKGIFDFEV